jgi:hypothetical protein
MQVIIVTNRSRCSLHPVLFGLVVALAFVLVVTAVSQHVPSVIGAVVNSQITDLDLEEIVETENTNLAGTTNQTTTSENMTGGSNPNS